MKEKKVILIVLFVLMFLTQTRLIAQVIPDTLWTKTFGGIGKEQALSVRETFDAGYIIVGATNSYGNGGRDVWLIKTDENGNEIWNKTFGGTNDDLASFVQPTSDGGFILTGSTQSFGNGGEDIWLIKVDGNGNELWNKTFGGIAIDNAYSLQITFDEGYILAGITKSFGSGEDDIWLIKTNENGDEIWNNKFGGFGNDITYSVQQTADSGYIISGFTNSSGNGEMDIWFIKTDMNGNVIWNKTYGGSLDDLAFSGQQTSDGGYIAAGSTYSYGNGQDDFYLIKLSSDGPEEIKNIGHYNPDNFLLMQNYPNPFNPATKIKYHIPELSYVTLKVYDVLGNEIETLVNEEKPEGSYEIDFNAADISSGMYFYQLKAVDHIETMKMLLIK